MDTKQHYNLPINTLENIKSSELYKYSILNQLMNFVFFWNAFKIDNFR